MSEIDEIRVFVQLVESKSSTRAAEALGVAISAVSRRMKDLEKRLGVQLIQRTTRRMSLTEAGQVFYQRCKRLLEDLEEAKTEVSVAARSLSGSLKIAAPLGFGVDHLMPAVSAFMLSHPDLRIELDMSDRRIDLLQEGVDMAIRIGFLEDSNLMARKISTFYHHVCASEDFLNKYGIPQVPQELTDKPALCYANVKQPGTWLCEDAMGKRMEVKVSPRLIASNGDALCKAGVAGLGVLCEPSFIVNRYIDQGYLKRILTDFRWYGMSIYAVYPQTRYLSSRVRHFIDFLIEYFGPEPYWETR